MKTNTILFLTCMGLSALFHSSAMGSQSQTDMMSDSTGIRNAAFHEILNGYLKSALRHNPRIAAAAADWQAQRKQIGAVRGLPDPTFNFGYFLENVETAVGPQQWKAGFMQMIPWPGKLITQGSIQSQKAEAAQHHLQSVIADVSFQVETVYLDAYYLERSIAVTQENLDLVGQWEQVILAKYRTAAASQADLIKTQIETIKLQDDLATLKARRLPLLERFRALINTDTLSHLIFPDKLSDPGMSLDKVMVREAVLSGNPDLASMKSMQKAAEKSLVRTKLNWLPDFSVGLDYINTGNRSMGGVPVPESGKDPVIVMGSLTFPLWAFKQADQVSAAREKTVQSQQEVQSKINGLEVTFEQAWFAYEDAERKQRLYQEQLLPKSLESLRTTEKAYIGDQVEFLSLVDAQRRYLSFKLISEKSIVDTYKAIALLQKMTGRSL